MFKAPERSKRRLETQVGALAATAAGRLFECAFEDAGQWPGPVCFAPAEETDARWLTDTFGPQTLVVPQRAGTLGTRINAVNRSLEALSYPRQLYIGIDCPQLGTQYLRRAAAELATHDLVVGPASDGGAVVIGTRKPLPDLAHLPWSTATLLDALLELATSQEWTTFRMSPLADVDTLEDLLAAADALQSDPRAARRAFCDFVAQAARNFGPNNETAR
jgi:hypothetical protein